MELTSRNLESCEVLSEAQIALLEISSGLLVSFTAVSRISRFLLVATSPAACVV